MSLKLRILPTSIVAAACLVIATLINGGPGLFGAEIGRAHV